MRLIRQRISWQLVRQIEIRIRRRFPSYKLRDSVIISIQDENGELARYKNIELPDELRDLSVEDCQFSKNSDKKLEFELYFAKGSLPKPMPEPRGRKTRADKVAVPVKAEEATSPKTEPRAAQAPVKDRVAAPAKAVKPGNKEPSKTETTRKTTTLSVAAKTAISAATQGKPKDTLRPAEKSVSMASPPATAKVEPKPAAPKRIL